MAAPLLVFGWGNASRGDDALGPLFVERLRERLGDAATGRVDFLDDYQLQPEHALDLVGRERVLFVDASLDGAAPFETHAVLPRRDDSFSSHAMSAAAVLQVYAELQGCAPPPCTLLAIRGERFELGDPPGEAALVHLAAALDWVVRWVRAPAR
jgi:hydrogenase maturation protease